MIHEEAGVWLRGRCVAAEVGQAALWCVDNGPVEETMRGEGAKRDVAQPLITHQYSPAFKVASLCMHVCAHLLLLLVEARSEFERLTGRHLRHHHFLLVGK